MITEMANPVGNPQARFLELYSPKGQQLDGLVVVRYTTAKRNVVLSSTVTEIANMDLIEFAQNKSLQPKEFLVLCANKSVFETTFVNATCVEVPNNGHVVNISSLLDCVSCLLF
jgi:hypothetical protein